jgi:hypothetical protein
MNWVQSDGGRATAGFKGPTRDCVPRAIAIASGRPYAEVYAALNALAEKERPRNGRKRSSSRTGVNKQTYHAYLTAIGAKWTPTMAIGSGCKVHLKDGELPMGRLVVSVSRHLVAVIDGVIYDTDDPSRKGGRCVYGYYSFDMN